MRKYPIGIQNFANIRNDGYVYIDKTEYVWRLAQEGKYYFLSRPRRFGKSLLVSTLEAFFKGYRQLFKGLYIDTVDYDWIEYPVLHLDLNSQDYSSDDKSLERMLDNTLARWEQAYGIIPEFKDAPIRFANIIKTAYDITGRQVVVLIDEYDKPLLVNLFNHQRCSYYRNTLKSFYGVLKSCDQFIKFGLLTGVTKFGKVSVFSDLNNLDDITLSRDFNAICGISESEISEYFKEEIENLANEFDTDADSMAEQLRVRYDGYHFTRYKSEGVYNPFSLLNVFKHRSLDDFWFKTGTPSLLAKLLMRTNADLSNVSTAERSETDLTGLDPVFQDPVPVIFQSGYLTIKGFNEEDELYRLGFPNKEVERGFLNFLLPYYINPELRGMGVKISVFTSALRDGNVDEYMMQLQSFMSDIPYSSESARIPERRFSDVVFIVTRLMGYTVSTEYQTNRGRIDLHVKTDKYIYVIEFKADQSPDEALRQIDEKGYIKPFLRDGRTIVKVGAEFSTTERNIVGWKALPVKN